MTTARVWSVGLAGLVSLSVASVAGAAPIDYVVVGNANNAADPATGGQYGAVAYAYRISKNETTVAQYAEFLNAKAKSDPFGLYNTNMASRAYIAGITRSGADGAYVYSVVPGTGNKPITYVNYFDAARYANWVHNGGATAADTGPSTEVGAYTLNGQTTGYVARNPAATVWIPDENEWYKAAYYDPTKNGGAGGYWTYATAGDTMTGNVAGTADGANYYDTGTGKYASGSGKPLNQSLMALTDVGAYGSDSQSYYGTNDQSGNVVEVTDTRYLTNNSTVARGGSWINEGASQVASSSRIENTTDNHIYSVGFRVAAPVPEPASLGVLAAAAGALSLSRGRRRR